MRQKSRACIGDLGDERPGQTRAFRPCPMRGGPLEYRPLSPPERIAMWPIRRRRRPRLESVPIGELTTDPADYSILTVGQSRLADSFTELDFIGEESPRFVVSRAHPVIDPRMKAIADIELHVDGHVVGYLRPPALNEAIDLLSHRHAEALDIPIAIFSTPAGPEVRVHAELSEANDQER